MVFVADWGPLVGVASDRAIFVNLHVWVEVDIGGELGPSAGLALVVDFVGKFQQIRCGSNLVRIILRAAACQLSPLTTL